MLTAGFFASPGRLYFLSFGPVEGSFPAQTRTTSLRIENDGSDVALQLKSYWSARRDSTSARRD